MTINFKDVLHLDNTMLGSEGAMVERGAGFQASIASGMMLARGMYRSCLNATLCIRKRSFCFGMVMTSCGE